MAYLDRVYQQAYDRVRKMYSFLQSLFQARGYRLVLDPEGPSAVFFKNPTVAAAIFERTFERYKAMSVRATPDNFVDLFGVADPTQLNLNLEGRLEREPK